MTEATAFRREPARANQPLLAQAPRRPGALSGLSERSKSRPSHVRVTSEYVRVALIQSGERWWACAPGAV
jgi:hypothetical protein